MVVAADVLYEMAYAELVANAIAAALAPRGTAIIADPGRVAVDQFIGACSARGLTRVDRDTYPFVEGAIRQTITLFSIRRARVSIASARGSDPSTASKFEQTHDSLRAAAGVAVSTSCKLPQHPQHFCGVPHVAPFTRARYDARVCAGLYASRAGKQGSRSLTARQHDADDRRRRGERELRPAVEARSRDLRRAGSLWCRVADGSQPGDALSHRSRSDGRNRARSARHLHAVDDSRARRAGR